MRGRYKKCGLENNLDFVLEKPGHNMKCHLLLWDLKSSANLKLPTTSLLDKQKGILHLKLAESIAFIFHRLFSRL